MKKLLVITVLSGSLYAMQHVPAEEFERTDETLPREMAHLPKVFTQIEDELPKSWGAFYAECLKADVERQKMVYYQKRTLLQNRQKTATEHLPLKQIPRKKRKVSAVGITIRPLLQFTIPRTQSK